LFLVRFDRKRRAARQDGGLVPGIAQELPGQRVQTDRNEQRWQISAHHSLFETYHAARGAHRERQRQF
jgi:hypothetical protein